MAPIQRLLNDILTLSRTAKEDLSIVGGALRNRILNLPIDDFDFAGHQAPELAQRFAAGIKRKAVILDATPGRETVRVVLSAQTTFDFSRMQGGNIQQDLNRRDFTFNAMAQPLGEFIENRPNIIDPHGGCADLRRGIVRVLPGPIFTDDPLRMLRAFRFAAALRFQIEPDTLAAIRKYRRTITQVATERILYELNLFFSARETYPLLSAMANTGLLQEIFPEIATPLAQSTLAVYSTLEGGLNGTSKIFSIFQLKGAPLCPDDAEAWLKFATLLHRLNDPAGARRKDSAIALVLRRLHAGNDQIRFIESLVRSQRLASATPQFITGKQDVSQMYAFIKQAGRELTPALLLATAAHATTSRKAGGKSPPYFNALKSIHKFYRERYLPAQSTAPLLNGDDLKNKFRLTPSPLFRKLLEDVEEKRVLGKIKTRREAETYVRKKILQESATEK
jgi:tRNA nucleotidyltransferase/poly(A) polymerase